MQCTVASLEQMGPVVCHLLQYAQSSRSLNEEKCYYLRLILNELITNGFKHGGGRQNAVRVDVDVVDGHVEIIVDDGGLGLTREQLVGSTDVYSESGRGLTIVRGLCQSVELNDRGNRVTAKLSLQ